MQLVKCECISFIFCLVVVNCKCVKGPEEFPMYMRGYAGWLEAYLGGRTTCTVAVLFHAKSLDRQLLGAVV